jgi:hypothetical protein
MECKGCKGIIHQITTCFALICPCGFNKACKHSRCTTHIIPYQHDVNDVIARTYKDVNKYYLRLYFTKLDHMNEAAQISPAIKAECDLLYQDLLDDFNESIKILVKLYSTNVRLKMTAKYHKRQYKYITVSSDTGRTCRLKYMGIISELMRYGRADIIQNYVVYIDHISIEDYIFYEAIRSGVTLYPSNNVQLVIKILYNNIITSEDLKYTNCNYREAWKSFTRRISYNLQYVDDDLLVDRVYPQDDDDVNYQHRFIKIMNTEDEALKNDIISFVLGTDYFT